MSELYLIAHKVRNEVAFDVAERMCSGTPPCQPDCGLWKDGKCLAADWWIIPTSGHRAYPYWHHKLDDLYNHHENGSLCIREMIGTDEAPEGLRDHYAVVAADTIARSSKPKTASLEDLA